MKTPGPELTQAWPRPSHPRPIVIIGAGAIVRTAHLPVYRRLGYPIAGIFDIDPSRRARRRASSPSTRSIPRSRDAAAHDGGDLRRGRPRRSDRRHPRAAAARLGGADAEADGPRPRRGEADPAPAASSGTWWRRSTSSCVSAPACSRCTTWSSRGALGALVDIDVRVVIDQPWQLWTFLERRAAGRGAVPLDPLSRRDPLDRRRAVGRLLPERRRTRRCPQLRDARSSIILDYGDRLRCSLVLNHTHRAGPKHRASQIMVEGARRRRPPHLGREPRLPHRPAATRWRSPAPASGARCRCAARGSSKRSKGRCRTCSGSSPAKTPRWSAPSPTRSRRWRWSRPATNRARAAARRSRAIAEAVTMIDAHQHFWTLRPGRVRLDR